MMYKCPKAHEKMFNITTSKVRDQNGGDLGKGRTVTKRAEAEAGMLDNVLSVWVCWSHRCVHLVYENSSSFTHNNYIFLIPNT